MIQSENICLKWDDFKGNTEKNFKSLRSEPDFSDVTLVSKDNQHIKAHRVILSGSSPVFHSMLYNIDHMHPLIYMSGIESKYLTSLVDFIYYGEVNIYQGDMDGFLVLAEKLQLKGLSGIQNDSNKILNRLKPLKES